MGKSTRKLGFCVTVLKIISVLTCSTKRRVTTQRRWKLKSRSIGPRRACRECKNYKSKLRNGTITRFSTSNGTPTNAKLSKPTGKLPSNGIQITSKETRRKLLRRSSSILQPPRKFLPIQRKDRSMTAGKILLILNRSKDKASIHFSKDKADSMVFTASNLNSTLTDPKSSVLFYTDTWNLLGLSVNFVHSASPQ